MLKSMVQKIADRFEVRILGKEHYLLLDHDMEPEFKAIYQRCQPYTMTSIERMYALFNAVRYVVSADLPGAFVECGVWRGGSMMLVAETLKLLGCTDRPLYLYDTFRGMSKGTARDVTFKGTSFGKWFRFKPDEEYVVSENMSVSLIVPLDVVRHNLAQTGYPLDQMVFVEGKVEDTIPATIPAQIACLRLDTDWYELTYHELVHLFPLLVSRGVLIIDDYGHWQGSREATDQYVAEQQIHMLMQRADYTCRVGIK